MPKPIAKKSSVRVPADAITGPARTKLPGSINPFTIPAPRGKNPGPVSRSTAWKPREATEVDEAEEGAFRRPQVGDVMPPSPRNRIVSEAAMSAAQLRMSGKRIEQDEHENESAAPYDDSDDDDTEDAEPEQTLTSAIRQVEFEGRAKKIELQQMMREDLAAQKARAPRVTHPSEQFDPNIALPGTAVTTASKVPVGTIQHPSGLALHLVSIADVDRLWDWIRQDPDMGAAFLGHTLTTSIALHQFMSQLVQAEASRIAAIRSLYTPTEHIGFAMLAPILTTERTALMHIYLREDARGHLATLVGPLVDMAESVVPNTHLAVWSPDPQWARLHRKVLTPFGFTERVMFIR